MAARRTWARSARIRTHATSSKLRTSLLISSDFRFFLYPCPRTLTPFERRVGEGRGLSVAPRSVGAVDLGRWDAASHPASSQLDALGLRPPGMH